MFLEVIPTYTPALRSKECTALLATWLVSLDHIFRISASRLILLLNTHTYTHCPYTLTNDTPRTMAKSTRSKVKRSFRAKKREQGVYAATEAARLARLHQKLHGIASTDAEGDVAVEGAEQEEMYDEAEHGGSYWSFWLGVLDHEAITPDTLAGISKARSGATGFW